ncbi:hypothetical protein QQX98_013143 [Neonectria punicea]|uniref:Protein kinase domain-containing protein n=1 Tax=Neonectria punicea TaxID=979145 RepID=A0ABR1GH96_9HYPO
MDEYDSSSRKIKFGFGHSQLTAIGHYNDHGHPHVLHLTLQRSPFTRAASQLLLRLPSILQSLVRPLCPGWLLPTSLILKKLKPGWDDEFDNEKRMYERLQDLQGSTIPFFHGEGRCEGTRALILSKVNGVEPFNQNDPLPLVDFQDRASVAFDALRARGVMYDDIKLDNLLITGDRIVLIDLESVWEPEDMDYFFKSCVDNIVRLYNIYLSGLEMDF